MSKSDSLEFVEGYAVDFVFENTGVAMCVFGDDYVISRCNRFFEKLSGFSKKEVEGNIPWNDFIPEPDKKRLLNYHDLRSKDEGSPPKEYDCDFVSKDGSLKAVHVTINMIPNSKNRIVSLVDVTEKKKSHERLVESKKRLDLALKGGDLGTWDWNIKTNEVTFDDRWAEMKGYKLDELKPHISTWESLVHPDDLPEAKKRLQDHIDGKNSFYEATFRMKNSSDDWIWVLDKGKVIEWDSEGNPVRACGTHLDVTKLKKTEEKLKESRSQFETLFNSLKDGVFVHPVSSDNQPGNFERVNESASRILGYTAEEFNKMSPWDLDDPKTCDDYIPKAMDDLKKNGEAVFEAIQVTKDGRKLPVEINTRVIQFKGKPHIISVTRDISERKKAEDALRESERELKEAQELAKMGRWDYIHSDDKLIWSDTIYKIFEVDSDTVDVSYEAFLDSIHPDDRQKVNSIWKKSLQEKKPYNLEHRVLTDEGQVKWVKEKCRTKFDEHGNPVHSVGVVLDITDEKKAEIKLKKAHEKLKDLNQNLEDKVKERTDEIQGLLRQKDVFINQLGHDLKTPLTPLVTLLPVLKSKVDDNKAKELIETLEQNTEYMRGLVEKTIQLALINSPNTKLDFKKKNLKKLIEKNVDKNKIYFKENKVYLENKIENDIEVEVDSFHFEELIDNLFTNAVKYSDSKKPKIVVDADSDKESIVVSIKDYGVGMTKDQIKNIFDEFYKADSSRHDFKSSGLGMTIAKRIVEKHGGRIWVESPGPGKGSTFYFTLRKPNKNREDN